MYIHQFCDSNSSYGTKRDFQILMAAILKWPKIGSPSCFYLMTASFDIRGGLMSKKNLVSDFHRLRVHSNPLWPME